MDERQENLEWRQRVLNQHSWNAFLDRVTEMNEVMLVSQSFDPHTRLVQLRRILLDEVAEINDVIDETDGNAQLVQLADLMGDLIVYCVSECHRWKIPIGEVLSAIMDSQNSKLVDGKPVPSDTPGKFGKGPDYHPPEGAIEEIILRHRGQ